MTIEPLVEKHKSTLDVASRLIAQVLQHQRANSTNNVNTTTQVQSKSQAQLVCLTRCDLALDMT